LAARASTKTRSARSCAAALIPLSGARGLPRRRASRAARSSSRGRCGLACERLMRCGASRFSLEFAQRRSSALRRGLPTLRGTCRLRASFRRFSGVRWRGRQIDAGATRL
jgi:hypothetical protein